MRIDDVGCTGLSEQQAQAVRNILREGIDLNRPGAKQSHRRVLTSRPAPGLCHDPSGNVADSPGLMELVGQSQHPGVPTLKCDHRAGVQHDYRHLRSRTVCILTRMSRLQVYLPDELHRQLKEHGLAPSELLQRAVREEVHRRELEAATDAYLAELIEEVGEPRAADVEYAKRFVRDLTGAADRQAG